MLRKILSVVITRKYSAAVAIYCRSQVHHKSEEMITTISKGGAERKILITIEYDHYTNIHIPSHIRLLSTNDQVEFYKEKLHTDTMKFYLIDNSEFD